MDSTEIIVKEQWDTIQTMHELLKLEEHVMDFLSHTIQTMMQPSNNGMYMLGGSGEVEYEHPLGRSLSIINSLKRSVYQQYGEDMFKQGRLFDIAFTDEVDNG